MMGIKCPSCGAFYTGIPFGQDGLVSEIVLGNGRFKCLKCGNVFELVQKPWTKETTISFIGVFVITILIILTILTTLSIWMV